MASAEAQRPWLMLAVLSGACAAFNGAFAKMTTTALTASWAHSIASLMHIPSSSKATEYLIRTLFFVLNMVFNAVMWGLFTKALASGPSAIRVNVINTASNFLITAVMGYLVFEEHLPPLWFVGASMLVAGSVIIGGRDGVEQKSDDSNGSSDNSGDLKKGALENVPVHTGVSAAQTAPQERARKRRSPASSAPTD